MGRITLSEDNYSIYAITNLINNKIYIGISCNPNRRWTSHKSLSRGGSPEQAIHRGMKKHGIDNFVFDILEDGLTQMQAIQKELRLIELYNTRNKMFGYNQMKGGTVFPPKISGEKHHQWGKPNKQLSELSKSRIGIPLTAECKAQLSKSLKGRVHSPETLVKLSDNKKNYWQDPVKKAKHVEGLRRTSKERGIACIGKSHNCIRVVCNETGVEYPSARQAGILMGFGINGGISIRQHLRGDSKSAYGFTFSKIQTAIQ